MCIESLVRFPISSHMGLQRLKGLLLIRFWSALLQTYWDAEQHLLEDLLHFRFRFSCHVIAGLTCDMLMSNVCCASCPGWYQPRSNARLCVVATDAKLSTSINAIHSSFPTLPLISSQHKHNFALDYGRHHDGSSTLLHEVMFYLP